MGRSTRTEERTRQLLHEIDWLKRKLKLPMSEKQRKEYEHQIRERQLNIDHGIFEKQKEV